MEVVHPTPSIKTTTNDVNKIPIIAVSFDSVNVLTSNIIIEIAAIHKHKEDNKADFIDLSFNA